MEHLRLGEILINQGLISEQQLDQAIEQQKSDYPWAKNFAKR